MDDGGLLLFFLLIFSLHTEQSNWKVHAQSTETNRQNLFANRRLGSRNVDTSARNERMVIHVLKIIMCGSKSGDGVWKPHSPQLKSQNIEKIDSLATADFEKWCWRGRRYAHMPCSLPSCRLCRLYPFGFRRCRYSSRSIFVIVSFFQ